LLGLKHNPILLEEVVPPMTTSLKEIAHRFYFHPFFLWNFLIKNDQTVNLWVREKGVLTILSLFFLWKYYTRTIHKILIIVQVQ
jgi:hypothetical protein